MVLAVVLFMLICGRAIPQNPIVSPGAAFTAPTMFVAPDGDDGDSEDSNDQSDEQDQTDQQKNRDDNSKNTKDQAAAGQSGSQSQQGSNSTNGEGGGSGNNREDRRNLGFLTNLADFASISTSTKAPDAISFTREGKSGFDQNANVLWFYALPNEAANGYSVAVEYSSPSTGGQVQAANAGGDGMYSIPVPGKGQTATVELTLIAANGYRTNHTATFAVTFSGRLAPELNVRGIEDGKHFEQSSVDIYVSATNPNPDAYVLPTIYSDNITVTLDGQTVDTYSPQPEFGYSLYLMSYVEGDTTKHTVTVTAYDPVDKTVSTTYSYTIYYDHRATGTYIGDATLMVDATTVGLGMPIEVTVPLHEGYPFAYDMSKALAEQGIDVVASGPSDYSDPEASGWSGYYLSRINSNSVGGGSLPSLLRSKLEDDGITITDNSYSNSLGEGDFTMPSGWLFRVASGGSVSYPGKTLGSYNVQVGDVVTLVFEVAGGKETGSASSYNPGIMSTYCWTWADGTTYGPNHDISVYAEIVPPTCGISGLGRYECSAEHSLDASNPGLYYISYDEYGNITADTTTVTKYGAFGSAPGLDDEGYFTIAATGQHDWQVDYANTYENGDGTWTVAYYCSECSASMSQVEDYRP